MPRTKEFDVDAALDSAVELFWSQGFEATSIQDLVDSLGINRGSLYDTFGSKEDLYERALDKYISSNRQRLSEILASGLPLRDKLQTLLLSMVENPDGRGCFVVNTASERNFGHAPSQRATAQALSGNRKLFTDFFESVRDELAPGLAPAVASEMILVLIQGLQVMTTVGNDSQTLTPVVEATLDRVLGT